MDRNDDKPKNMYEELADAWDKAAKEWEKTAQGPFGLYDALSWFIKGDSP